MKMTPYDKSKLSVRMPRSNNYGIIEEFVRSGYECVKLEGYTQRDATICALSLRASIKRYGFHVDVAKRGEDVYLIKK